MAFGRLRKKKQDDADASPMQDAPADAAEAPDAGDTTATAGAGVLVWWVNQKPALPTR